LHCLTLEEGTPRLSLDVGN